MDYGKSSLGSGYVSCALHASSVETRRVDGRINLLQTIVVYLPGRTDNLIRFWVSSPFAWVTLPVVASVSAIVETHGDGKGDKYSRGLTLKPKTGAKFGPSPLGFPPQFKI